MTPHTFAVDIYEAEDKEHFVVEAALPGFKQEEIKITAIYPQHTAQLY